MAQVLQLDGYRRYVPRPVVLEARWLANLSKNGNDHYREKGAEDV
jgi:hypothetical protein